MQLPSRFTAATLLVLAFMGPQYGRAEERAALPAAPPTALFTASAGWCHLSPVGPLGKVLDGAGGPIFSIAWHSSLPYLPDPGLSTGYWSFLGRSPSVEEATMIPVLLTGSWRIAILPWLSLDPRLGLGPSFLTASYDPDGVDPHHPVPLFDSNDEVELTLLLGLAVGFSLGKLAVLRLGTNQFCFFEKDGALGFSSLGIEYGVRL